MILNDVKLDLRIKKTQRALAMAMLSLLEQQPLSKITVNDLCTRAMISRSAFYSHFEDKYALVKFCMDMIKNDLFEEGRGMGLRERIVQVLSRIDNNSRLYKNLMLAEVDIELINMLHVSFNEDFKRIIEENNVTTLPGPAEVIATYFAAGVTAVILNWLRKNKPYSIDEMADCLCKLLPQLSDGTEHAPIMPAD